MGGPREEEGATFSSVGSMVGCAVQTHSCLSSAALRLVTSRTRGGGVYGGAVESAGHSPVPQACRDRPYLLSDLVLPVGGEALSTADVLHPHVLCGPPTHPTPMKTTPCLWGEALPSTPL